jgi:hypothetical protein
VKGEGLQLAAGTAAPADGYLIRPAVDFIEPGNFNGFVNIPSEVHMDVQLVDASGAVVDEFRITSTIPADLSRPAVGQRLKSAAEQLADLTARYLKERTAPPKK